MGIKLSHLKYVDPIHAVKDGAETYKETGNIGSALLDPSNDLAKTPLNKKYAAIKSDKDKKKQRDSIYANARSFGYKGPGGMKKGGKVKIKKHTKGDNCRGMGAATRGGRYGKDG